MKLPLIALDIEEDIESESGVFACGLVDMPAIERNWMAFDKQVKFTIHNEEKRILAGFLMVANQPIYRFDKETKQEYYVTFPATSIEKIVKKVSKYNQKIAFNINHNDSRMVDNCYLMQHFIINTELGINTPKGFDEAPNGSWFGFVKVDDDETWNMVKSGEIKGFSVEGYFNEKKIMDVEKTTLEDLKNQLLEMKNDNKIKEFFAAAKALFSNEEPTPVPAPIDEPKKFGSVGLKDGSGSISYEGDTMIVGSAVMMNDQPLADGEYMLENDMTIIVSGGMIAEIKEPEQEESLNAEEVMNKIEEVSNNLTSEFNKQIEALKESHKLELNKVQEKFKKVFEGMSLIAGMQEEEKPNTDPRQKSVAKKQTLFNAIMDLRNEVKK